MLKYKNKYTMTLLITFLTIFILGYINDKAIVTFSITNDYYFILNIYSFFRYDYNKNMEKYGSTPIFYAKTGGMCLYLINHGANINKSTYFATPLFSAMCDKNYDLVQTLLANGANINFSLKGKKFDGIYEASCEMDDPKMLSILLEYTNCIGVEKMKFYISELSKFGENTDNIHWLDCSKMLLTTMLPSEQQEFIELLRKNKLINNDCYKILKNNITDPISIPYDIYDKQKYYW